MKKLNSKGFAISTLLYGLMIMSFLIVLALISISGTNRKNTKTLVEKIEDELNRYSLTDTSGNYEGGEVDNNGREYIAPSNGWYKIELWGASGGNNTSSSPSNGGKGSYTSGTIYLEANDHLYFYIGQAGPANRTLAFNGGGPGSPSNVNYQSGGGATDVRIIAGAWNDPTSLHGRLMVAGGGGGAGSLFVEGGMGGTLVGGNGYKSHPTVDDPKIALGGTQSAGGSHGVGSHSSGTDGSIGLGGTGGTYLAGGGGGYFGGGASGVATSYAGSGAGGSSFIMGYAGARAVNDSGTATTNTSRSYNIEYGQYDENGNPVKSTVTPVIYNGLMVPGVNSGNGKFSVTKVSDNAKDNPPRKGSNTKLNNVRYIKDCVDSSTVAATGEWIEIQAITNGTNVAKGAAVTGSGLTSGTTITDGIADSTTATATMSTTGQKCVTITLNNSYNLDEIAVWHQYSDARSYRGHTLQVSSNNSTWQTVRSKSTETDTTGQEGEVENANGIRYNSIQPDMTAPLPDGNYYIFAGNTDNEVLTYDPGDNDNARVSLFQANKAQIWRVEKRPNGYYQIIETSVGNALSVTDGTSDVGVNIDLNINSLNNPSQDWTITPLGNGYYKIISRLGTRAGVNGKNVVTQANASAKTQRFKFINSEY